VCLAIALALAGWISTQLALRVQSDEVKTRAMLYAFAVISNLTPGLESSEGADIQRVGRYLALSGLAYAQLTSGDRVLLETAVSQEASAILDDAQSARTPHLEFTRVGGCLVVDIILPYGRLHADENNTSAGDGQVFPTGYLRLGIDAGDFATAAAKTESLAALAGLAGWIVACALVWVLLRRRPVATPMLAEEGPGIASRAMTAGNLALNMDTGCLDVAGRHVQLTPKQRDFVALLLSEPGRPFRDDEILERVWADSRYANSRDVKQYVYLIRRRLAAAGLPADEVLANEPGLGYRIVSDAVPTSIDPAIDPASVDEPPQKDEGCSQT
jgi:DNA-binding winged helix-turn-helix (wHTH) protein